MTKAHKPTAHTHAINANLFSCNTNEFADIAISNLTILFSIGALIAGLVVTKPKSNFKKNLL